MKGIRKFITAFVLAGLAYQPFISNHAQELLLPAIDITAPVLKHQPISGQVPTGKPVEISVVCSDNTGVKSVTAFYRVAGTEQYQRLPLIQGDTPSSYTAKIPMEDVRTPGLEYYMQAVDLAGNTVLRGFDFSPLKISVGAVVLEQTVSAPPEPTETVQETTKKGISSTTKWGLTGLGVAGIAGLGVALGGGGGDDGGGGSTDPLSPTAVAGPDQTVTDDDNSGTESVRLDGSGSTSESEIVSYEWLESGQAIATGDKPRVDLTVGTHTITLKVTNSDGLTGEDSVIINVVVPTQSAGTLQFSSQSFTVGEDDGLATITVTRAGGSSGPATVNYSTSNGTATADTDYTPNSGSLSWADGEGASKTFEVPILSDSVAEGDETVNLTLSTPTGAILGSPSTATLSIADVAVSPGTLQFSTKTFSVGEDDGLATIEVTRTGGSSGAATVNYSTSAGTATAGSDYTAVSGTLNWTDGDSAPKTFEVPILSDNVTEEIEALFLNLSNPTGATLGSLILASLAIIDASPAAQNTLPSTATKIERISGSNQRLGLGQTSSPLKVRVSTGAAQGVSNAQLRWTLIPADGGSFTGGGSSMTTTTDSNGESTVTLTVSRLGPLTITAAADNIGTVEFGINRFAGVAGLTENQRAIAGALDNACPALGSLQRALTAAEQDLLNTCNLLAQESNLGTALQQLAPQSVSAQGKVQLSLAKIRSRNILLRLDYLRGGATGPSLEGLSVAHGNTALPLALLKDTVGDERGGGASADEGRYINRWGMFVNGSVSFGDADTTNRDLGFEFDTTGLTLGVDYRFNDKVILGGALNVISSDSDFENSGGKLDTDGYGLSLYGTYYQSEHSFIDGVVSVGRNDYENRRAIRFGSIDQSANSDTMGLEYSLDMGAGYEFNRNGFTAVPQARIHYTHVDIDAYQERMLTSDSGLALGIAEQTIESLRTALGTQFSYALSTSYGVYVPHLLVEWEHEFKDDSRLISAHFLNDPTRSSFTLKTDSPDTNFFNLGAGLSATFRGGLSGFLYYETTLAQKKYSSNLVLGRLRFEF